MAKKNEITKNTSDLFVLLYVWPFRPKLIFYRILIISQPKSKKNFGGGGGGRRRTEEGPTTFFLIFLKRKGKKT